MKLKTHQWLVLFTATIALALLTGGIWHVASSSQETTPPAKIAQIKPFYPKIGSMEAEIELVVFADYQCAGCKAFHEEVLPELTLRYVEPGLVRLRIVPLEIVDGSALFAKAAIAVYDIAPHQFHSFSEILFAKFADKEIDAMTKEEVLQEALELGEIDVSLLDVLMDSERYEEEVAANLLFAQSVLGEEFHLPAVLINGKVAHQTDLAAIEQEIEEAL